MGRKLTARQDRFCQEYAACLNATESARRSGYAAAGAEQTASKLLRNPKVAVRIAELQAERAQRIEITAEQTIRDLREAADIALGRWAYPKTVISDGQAQVVMVKNVNLAAAARALELLVGIKDCSTTNCRCSTAA